MYFVNVACVCLLKARSLIVSYISRAPLLRELLPEVRADRLELVLLTEQLPRPPEHPGPRSDAYSLLTFLTGLSLSPAVRERIVSALSAVRKPTRVDRP